MLQVAVAHGSASEILDGADGGNPLDHAVFEFSHAAEQVLVQVARDVVCQEVHRDIEGNEEQGHQREFPPVGEHQGKGTCQQQGPRRDAREPFGEHAAHLEGIGDPGVQFPGSPALEKADRQAEKVSEVVQNQVSVHPDAGPEGEDGTSVSDKGGAEQDQGQEDRNSRQFPDASARYDRIDDVLQKQRSRDARSHA